MVGAIHLLRTAMLKAYDFVVAVAICVRQSDVVLDYDVSIRQTDFAGPNRVYGGTTVRNCKVGRYTYFSTDSFINNADVGNFCSIGPGVRIGMGMHPSRGWISTSPAWYTPSPTIVRSFSNDEKFEQFARTEIGHDVWIGANVCIMDGVKIGTGAIVGAGSVVTRDVPAYHIYGGIPARQIRSRFPDDVIDKLQKLKWWEWDDQRLKKAAPSFGFNPDDPKDIYRVLEELESLAAVRAH